ncbi:MAG: hypothetical protein ACFB02_20520 [Mastigocoleus sp.]
MKTVTTNKTQLQQLTEEIFKLLVARDLVGITQLKLSHIETDHDGFMMLNKEYCLAMDAALYELSVIYNTWFNTQPIAREHLFTVDYVE